jgi:REP element-mobilizing transposase RayT
MFESNADMAAFVDELTRAVDRGYVEVHAMALLSTHFHLLLRSPGGELPSAMHDVQLNYVRHFNRTRRRDGPLVRGRFWGRHVDSEAYRRAVIGYIDRNPVEAGLAQTVGDFPFGSARHYLAPPGQASPAWLTRGWIEDTVRTWLGEEHYDPRGYLQLLHGADAAAADALVERRLRSGRRALARTAAPDPTDTLLRGASPAVLDWMRDKAALADGTLPGEPVLPPSAVEALALLAPLTETRRRWGRFTSREALLHCLLLRHLCGLTLAEIARRTGGSIESIRRAVVDAQHRFDHDLPFATHFAALAHRSLVQTFGQL